MADVIAGFDRPSAKASRDFTVRHQGVHSLRPDKHTRGNESLLDPASRAYLMGVDEKEKLDRLRAGEAVEEAEDVMGDRPYASNGVHETPLGDVLRPEIVHSTDSDQTTQPAQRPQKQEGLQGRELRDAQRQERFWDKIWRFGKRSR